MLYCFFVASVGNLLKTLSRIPRRSTATKTGTARKVIVCRTNDEVNADLARSWCDDHGMDFQPADQRDELFPAEACALAIDLNHLAWGPSERAQFVERLNDVVPPYPVAVASYDLDHAAQGALAARGFFMVRRIEREVFDKLAQAVGSEDSEFAA